MAAALIRNGRTMELWIKVDAQAMIVVAIAAAIIIIIRLVPWERRRHDETIHITGE